MASQFHLFATRRFLPLFVTQFLGAANDNLFKNAMVILTLYALAAQGGGQVLVTMAAGVFILPFFLFSATAGQLADKYDKGRLIRIIKFAEIVIMGLGAAGLALGQVWFLLAVLFLMGAQSAFFGPLKYAILPQHLAEHELVGGNALVEAGTFLAILLGTIAGGLLILGEGGVATVSALVLALAVAGFAAALAIPKAPPGSPSLRINPNIWAETKAILAHARQGRAVFLSILGISWFWLVGATFLSQFPAFAKDVLASNEQVVTLFLTVFSVGIALGSVLSARLLKGEVSARYAPIAAIGISVFALDLALSTPGLAVPGQELMGVAGFLGSLHNWRILADLLLIAVCGGLYIVPLYSILQTRADEAHRARTIAANNVMNALFMTVAAGATALMLAAGFTVGQVFLTVALINFVVAVYICGLLPDALLKQVLGSVLRLLYRVDLHGEGHVEQAGPSAVIVVNHVSFLDALLLVAFLPGRPTFAINTHVARWWWVRPFLALVDAYPLDPTNPMATKGLIRAVQEGRRVVIFPEGRITVTGALMKIYEGPGMIADKAGAPLLPVRIEGAQYSPFSRLKGKVRLRLFPKIDIHVQHPRRFELPAELTGRQRRQMAGQKLYDVMSELIFATGNARRTLFQALLDAKAIHGSGAPILEDVQRKPLTYGRLVTGALVLGRRLAAETGAGDAVGVLLPNAQATAVVLFGLGAHGRVPALLNFSTGAGNMLAACRAAELRLIVTSRRFVEQARLEEAVAHLAGVARILYLEDLKARMGLLDKLWGLAATPFARSLHAGHRVLDEDAAAILFTSGSEGVPKGVALSHRNILSNCLQLAARVDFSPADVVFNALPVFHSFGLTGGLMLPLLSGVRTFLYPSPLHYRIVPVVAYDANATILFGTDTFLSGYARAAHPYDFYSVRYVFAGAERVKDETRRVWADKFGLRILEGYGATECAPVIATNTPMHYRPGTVGRFLPGLNWKLEPVPGIAEGGRLLVQGPNVMSGYLKVDEPGLLQPPEGGWYDTGDIVSVDAEGYVTIRGRAKRFAKVAGEMVSLTAVEQAAGELWPGAAVAAVAVPDAKKGEQVVLVTDRPDAGREALLAHARARGQAEILVPRTVLVVGQVPLLGTGKTDYGAVARLVAGQEEGVVGQGA